MSRGRDLFAANEKRCAACGGPEHLCPNCLGPNDWCDVCGGSGRTPCQYGTAQELPFDPEHSWAVDQRVPEDIE